MKIVGVLPVYNEADILEQIISYMRQQQIPLIIIDDESNDGSLEIERRFLGAGVLEVRTVSHTPYHERKTLLTEAYRRALDYSPDWIVYHDADEFLESPFPNTTLRDAIETVDKLGFNLIQFDCFDFCLTERDFNSPITDLRKRFRYYTWQSDYYYRAWKNYPGIDIVTNAGHRPILPVGVEERVPAFKFALRHYRFRSVEHGMKKVFKERLPRYDPKERAIGWHIHYDTMKPDANHFIIPSSKLSRYDENGDWNRERKFDTSFGAWNQPTDYEHFTTATAFSSLSQELQRVSKKLEEIAPTQNARENRQQQFDAIYQSPPVRLYLALKRRLGRL